MGAVILANGNDVFDPSKFDTYNYSNHPNIVTSLEFERILSASGPYRGHLMRPYDREEPKKIAWLQCVGSRDLNHCDNPYCSGVCCMYAIKGRAADNRARNRGHRHRNQGVEAERAWLRIARPHRDPSGARQALCRQRSDPQDHPDGGVRAVRRI
ncbi:MAG: hypothetical protein ACLGPL_01395 [Acidobacteriota bacterium]